MAAMSGVWNADRAGADDGGTPSYA
jgi:hypothetical protein